MIHANYILLDSARMDSEMATARELNPEHSCLYEGDSERFLGVVAPWLFDFEENTPFANWVSKNAKRNDWGIFLRSDAEPIKIYRHLRKFLIVATEDGKELYFRFYDPRVLRVFLPTCDREQLAEFFGPIQAFIAEDENGLLVEYAFRENELTFKDLGEEMNEYFAAEGESKPVMRSEQIPADNSSPVDNERKKTEIGEQSTDAKKPPKDDGGWDFGF